jgi:predicted dithiol-disulfide oxidoreductase (DUF899 family)
MSVHAMPSIVDRGTWQRERAALLDREKAHTREGDAIAAARRRLPMTEIEPVSLIGAQGPTPLIDIFQGRSQLLVYAFMWTDEAPIAQQCEGCTISLWDAPEPSYLHARDTSFAVFSEGAYAELAPFRDFMGWTMPWYSTSAVRDNEAVAGGGEIKAFLRDGGRVFQTYDTTGRGVEALMTSLRLLDLTAYGRRETWEHSPEGWPQPDGACAWWRREGRPVGQWSRPGVELP